MIDPIVSTSGIAYPNDLTVLKKVYDHVCEEQGLSAGCPQAAKLAVTAMQLFGQGTFEEETLYAELRRA